MKKEKHLQVQQGGYILENHILGGCEVRNRTMINQQLTERLNSSGCCWKHHESCGNISHILEYSVT